MPYSANKKWKLKHPEKWREMKRRNYASTAKNNPNSYEDYTTREDSLILSSPLTDRQLHHVIGRSVQGIQGRRHKLKNNIVFMRNPFYVAGA